MKNLLILLSLFCLKADTKFEYKLLLGSWAQKNMANTSQTGIFIFDSDSIATLEMRTPENQLIGGLTGHYSIKRSEDVILMTIGGKEKTFKVLKLDETTLTLKNETDKKDAITLERYKP